MDWRSFGCWLSVILSWQFATMWAIDMTLEQKGMGSELVTSVTRKIQDSCIFPNDFQFLRRVAYVESDFGANITNWDSPEGKTGIWHVDEKDFKQSLNDTLNQEIYQKLKVEMTKLSLAKLDFTAPLYGALAARSIMAHKNPEIPLDLTDQAKYWVANYNPKGTVEKFLDKMKTIPGICKAQGADILFLLDSSGSIGESEFDNVKRLLTSIVSNSRFRVNDQSYKIAIDLFSTEAQRFVAFTNYTTKDQLLAFIPNVPFLNQGTNMHKAFKLAAESFKFARDRSKGLPRVIVFITDGQPDKDTGPPLEPANQLKQSGVEIFTIGVGTGIDKVLLDKLASEPKCMHTFIAKDYPALAAQFPSELEARTCQASVIVTNDTNNFTVPIGKNSQAYFVVPGNATGGITIRIEAVDGAGTAYVSKTVRNPSKFEHDFKLTGTMEKPGELHIVNATDTLFLTIEGLNETNKLGVSFNNEEPPPTPTIPPLRVHSARPAPVEKPPENSCDAKKSDDKCDQKGIVTTIVRRNETLITATTNITTITHETITQSCQSAEKKCCGGGGSGGEQKTTEKPPDPIDHTTPNPSDIDGHTEASQHTEETGPVGHSTQSIPFGSSPPPTPDQLTEEPIGTTKKSHGGTTRHPVATESTDGHSNGQITTESAGGGHNRKTTTLGGHHNGPSTTAGSGGDPYGGPPSGESSGPAKTTRENNHNRPTPSAPSVVTSGYKKKKTLNN